MNYTIDEEVWKAVCGYEGIYEVSSFGRVKTCKTGMIRKQNAVKGYYLVGLSKNGVKKRISVHRLVATAFIANPEGKREVNHLDEIKTNNHISNLSWATPKENSNWGTRNERISEYVTANPVKWKNANGKNKAVYQIDIDTGEIVGRYDSVGKALEAMGSSPKSGSLSGCLTGSGGRKTYKGFKWKYAN